MSPAAASARQDFQPLESTRALGELGFRDGLFQGGAPHNAETVQLPLGDSVVSCPSYVLLGTTGGPANEQGEGLRGGEMHPLPRAPSPCALLPSPEGAFDVLHSDISQPSPIDHLNRQYQMRLSTSHLAYDRHKCPGRGAFRQAMTSEPEGRHLVRRSARPSLRSSTTFPFHRPDRESGNAREDAKRSRMCPLAGAADGWKENHAPPEGKLSKSTTPGKTLRDEVGPIARISLWVRAGSSADAIGWDPWRNRWVVSCRAPPIGGRANRAVEILMADWLELPHTAVRWTKAGSSHAKVLLVAGATDVEVDRRLRSHVRTGTLES